MKETKIYKYTAIFEPAQEGGYIVRVPMLPGCRTQGETFEEAKKMIKDAIKSYLTVLKEDGDRIPKEEEELIETRIAVPVQI
ncbi:type II toxin-antitoxin system HicB family antitoxin [Patescibacteria group bacterium]|nr:type II toxin-antitoxin system HicB family antitoxin [Patescibacteria group bacterium]MBU4512913.1 type II toxin-antitoxin system HicB family antitoxin [Patescibacteria group bacterium]